MSRDTGRRSGREGPSIARGDGARALVVGAMVVAIGALALVVGAVALAVPASPVGEPTTWQSLLAPYSTGAPLPDGFRVQEIRRGPDNGIVISVRRPDGGAAVEVLVVERGRWKSVHESQSFTIDYELPHSPAAEREVITALLAETIRSRDHGLPAPDALPLRVDELGADAGVLPWWLEMLRGLRGVLLGSTLLLLALLVVVRSPVLAILGVVLGAIDVTARLVGVPLLRPDVGAVWIVPAALTLLALALRDRWPRSQSDLWLALTMAVVGLGLRLGLGPWGPLHVNGHGPRFVAGALHDPGDIAAYGPGYHEIFGPIAALAPASPDWAIFAGNAFFSALLPPLGFAIGRLTGLGTRAALAVALLLAIDPVALRMGATEAYLVSIAVFCTGASAAMLVALCEMETGGRWRAAALLVAAGLLLSQAARIHPCAWVLMATVPFVVPAGSCGSWRRRASMAVVAAVVSGGVLLCTSSTALLDVLGNIRAGTVFRPTSPSLWPLAWVALVAAVYGMGVPRIVAPTDVSRRWLALPAAVSVAAMLLTRHAFDASWIWEQAYFRLYLTLPVIAALACVPPAWFDRRWLVVSAAALLGLVWIRVGWPIVTDRSLEHREYRWVRAQLEQVPPECRVVHVAFAGRRVLLLPTYGGASRPAVAMDSRRPETVEAALSPASVEAALSGQVEAALSAPCRYYVHSSLCSTPEGRPECDAIERRLTLVPIARASFADVRVHETFVHDRDWVETWIARIERVDDGRVDDGGGR